MPFPQSPSNKDLHIENGITFRFLTAKTRWELWNDSDATETDLDSEIQARFDADSDLQKQIFDNDSDILALQSMDSDQWIAIYNNDSDILYLQEYGVKYRGRIDVTQDAPTHTKYADGDLYLATADGTVDSTWGGLDGLSVKINQAIIYADSDWRFLGGAGGDGADSDQIANVSNIYDYMSILPSEIHRRLHTLHYANQTDTLFFEKDSDVFYVFEGEAVYPRTPVLLDGYQRFIGNTPQDQVVVTFNGTGAATAGNIKIVNKDGATKTIQNLAVVTNQVTEADGSKSFDGISVDSEAVHLSIAYGGVDVVEFGDEIIFTPKDGSKSVLKCFDTNLVGFKRVSKIKLDLDSEADRLLSADSDLQVQITDNDSDIQWLYDRDSDFTKDYDSDILALKSKDSDLQVQITDNDSDILRLYSDDSDIRVRITDNDSDIAYLFTHAFKYRGQLDMTNEKPDSDYKVGDVYFSLKAGLIGDSDWGPLRGLQIAKHQAVIYSDSDWIFFGAAGGGGGLDDSDFHALKAKDSDARTDIDFIFNGGTFAQYDDDSEIEVNGIKFSGDSEYAALRWNDNDKTLDLFLSGEPILQVGQEIVFFAKANEDISNGDLVMFAGAQGDHLLMRKADRTVAGFRTEWIMGVATSDITNNQFGYVTQIGKVRGLNTSAYIEGQLLYMDSDNPGGLTGTEPEWPIKSVLVAAVTRSNATEGSIYVRVSNKPDLNDIHDVNITEPAEGAKHNQMIMWDSDTEFWVNRTIDTDFGTF